jgi:hypothetical protein
MYKRSFAFALVVAALFTSSAAWANRQQVWYDDSNRPFSADQTQDDFVRAIQQSLREYELHTQGAAIFEWGGVAVNPPCGGGANVRIVWDPTLPSNVCAQTTTYAPFAACPTGQVQFNPMFAWRAKWSPNTFDVCVNFQATLNHELAHWMRQIGNEGHVNHSVLTQVGNARDLLSRHLWNIDMDGINWGDWFFKIIFPAHTFTWKTENYDPWTGASSLRGIGAGSPLGTWPTEAFAPGANGQQFSAAWGSTGSIQFTQGDATSFAAPTVLSGWELATRHRVCTANNTGSDIFIAWASTTEVAPSPGGTGFDGSRAIYYTQSHDGGVSWTIPRAIPNAFTRAGISCSYDPTRGNIVLAYQGSGEEGVWVTHRNAVSAALDGWAWPTMLVGPRTPETPHITFDPFAGTTTGWLAWNESVDGMHKIRQLGYNGVNYALQGTLQTAVPSTSRLVRSPIVAHMANGTAHVAYSNNDPGGTLQSHRRTRGFESGSLSTAQTSENAPAENLMRYTGAAENTYWVHTLVGGHLLQGPN